MPRRSTLALGRLNSLNIIAPYKHLDMWVFDDARVGLSQEPFVSGADSLIDRAVADIPSAEKGFLLVFSSRAFPGHQIHLRWRRPEMSGNWYYSAELDHEAWLCPALFRYFDAAPSDLYVQCKPKPQSA